MYPNSNTSIKAMIEKRTREISIPAGSVWTLGGRPTIPARHSFRKANANLNDQVCFEGIGAWKQLATANAI